MYQETSPWALVTNALRIAAGCGVESTVSELIRFGYQAAAAHAVRIPGRCSPRLGAAPVVADDVCPVEVGRVKQRDDIGRRLLRPVVTTSSWPRRGRVAPLAGNQSPQTRGVQPFGDLLEAAGLLREAVQQDHHFGIRRAGVDDREPQRAPLKGVHVSS